MARKQAQSINGVLQELKERVVSIEEKLYGDGNSILERLARLETKQEQLCRMVRDHQEDLKASNEQVVERTALALQKRMVELLGTQVNAQMKSNRYQIIGLWIAIALAAVGFIVSKAVGIP